jgi:BirA family transcriptional regulator, biotin operon repressor / biotin---[acetyl-CoA-carboxylase] ligase
MIWAEQWQVRYLPSCASTNDVLKREWPGLARHLPVLLWAGEQSAGRGRDDRTWVSPPGQGLYASFALGLLRREALPLLSLASALAVCRALESHCALTFAVKWPNDILHGAGKIAGILIENLFKGEQCASIVGIGLNLNQRADDFPAALQGRATSLLALTGKMVEREAVLGTLAVELHGLCRMLETGAEAELLAEYRRRCAWMEGKTIHFHRQGQPVAGEFHGIAASGGAIIRGPAGDEVLFSGELSI